MLKRSIRTAVEIERRIEKEHLTSFEGPSGKIYSDNVWMAPAWWQSV